MDLGISKSRRNLLLTAAAFGTQIAISPQTFAKEKEDVGPAEDLMREHGGLNRILLIYEEGLRRINQKNDIDMSVLKKSADIIKTFIEDYHEKLEEEFIFPRMRQANKLVELVNTLEAQHKAGRKLTADIQKFATQNTLRSEPDLVRLKSAINSFITMYRPHESREDTVIFPAFHEMLSEKEYDKLGDKFEGREHQLFGKQGFEGVVEKIADLERAYDIYDLAKFTPKD